MRLKEVHSVYFLGAGGIGMSALARWFNANGKKVYGYDKTSTVLTKALESEGIALIYEDKVGELPEDFRQVNKGCLVVYTPAISQRSILLNYFQAGDFELYKRSEVLGLITKDYFTIAVAGTHGKTTTSSMVSHILKASGENVMAFIGGILQNYQSNMLLNDTGSDKMPIVVVEADEFDRSFHSLSPDIVILTTVDPDHLDVYGDDKEFVEGFKQFLEMLPSDTGQLIVNECINKDIYAHLPCAVLTYGHSIEQDVSFTITKSIANSEKFTLSDNSSFELGISGIHNVANAVGALISTRLMKVDDLDIATSLLSYRGVKRRFEYIVNREDIVYIDDYAHHPSEIEALLDSVKSIYPSRKITAVFQPHLFSRTNDFMDDFARQLSRVDELLLLDIYPARELPIEGVTSEALLEKIQLKNKCIVTKESAVKELSKIDLDILLTIGAGDIDILVNPIRNLIEVDKLIA